MLKYVISNYAYCKRTGQILAFPLCPSLSPAPLPNPRSLEMYPFASQLVWLIYRYVTEMDSWYLTSVQKEPRLVYIRAFSPIAKQDGAERRSALHRVSDRKWCRKWGRWATKSMVSFIPILQRSWQYHCFSLLYILFFFMLQVIDTEWSVIAHKFEVTDL